MSNTVVVRPSITRIRRRSDRIRDGARQQSRRVPRVSFDENCAQLLTHSSAFRATRNETDRFFAPTVRRRALENIRNFPYVSGKRKTRRLCGRYNSEQVDDDVTRCCSFVISAVGHWRISSGRNPGDTSPAESSSTNSLGTRFSYVRERDPSVMYFVSRRRFSRTCEIPASPMRRWIVIIAGSDFVGGTSGWKGQRRRRRERKCNVIAIIQRRWSAARLRARAKGFYAAVVRIALPLLL